jgi:starch synthase
MDARARRRAEAAGDDAQDTSSMKILAASAEVFPFFKTGGLADVARALPDALARRGHDVRVIMPGYTFLRSDIAAADCVDDLTVPWVGGPRRVSVARRTFADGAAVAFVTANDFFDTERPYDAERGDALSLGRRFAFFCRAVVAYARHWGADIVHLNDWPTGLVPLYALVDGMDAASLFSIHNLAYQGSFAPQLIDQIDVPAHFLRTENGVEFHGQLSFIKGGIALADRLATVSPTYAREIQTAEHGVGLHGLLSFRRRTLHGVLNAIDTDAWNPATDPLIPATYTPRTLARKAESRSALVARAGLADDGPVFGIVTRLAYQKGIDILLGALPSLLGDGVNLVVLGSGDLAYERALTAVAAQYPHRFAIRMAFDEELAHIVYAGADMFLMPSLYEPCGLGQMIAQRYGTPPVARRTGGLNDTIEDGATGFLFDDASPGALVDAVRRARATWERRGWRGVQSGCIKEDHGWDRSASEYERIFDLAIGAIHA